VTASCKSSDISSENGGIDLAQVRPCSKHLHGLAWQGYVTNYVTNSLSKLSTQNGSRVIEAMSVKFPGSLGFHQGGGLPTDRSPVAPPGFENSETTGAITQLSDNAVYQAVEIDFPLDCS
jgi:hypothetical protein